MNNVIKIGVRRSVGDAELSFQVEGTDLKDALYKASFFTKDMPDKCGVCSSKNIVLSSYLTKSDFVYIKMICQQCRKVSELGSRKDGAFWWKKWTDDSSNREEQGALPTNPDEDQTTPAKVNEEVVEDDDLPF